jgi:hypothetical protein
MSQSCGNPHSKRRRQSDRLAFRDPFSQSTILIALTFLQIHRPLASFFIDTAVTISRMVAQTKSVIEIF